MSDLDSEDEIMELLHRLDERTKSMEEVQETNRERTIRAEEKANQNENMLNRIMVAVGITITGVGTLAAMFVNKVFDFGS